MNLRKLVGFALLGVVASGACVSGPRYKPSWTDGAVSAPSENILWAVTGQELQRMGYPLGSGASPDQRHMVSGWKTQLAPFRGDGFREKAEVRFTPLERGRFSVEVRVQREVNQDIVRPLDPSYAEWEESPDDAEAARVILQRIQSRLSEPLEVGKPQPPAARR